MCISCKITVSLEELRLFILIHKFLRHLLFRNIYMTRLLDVMFFLNLKGHAFIAKRHQASFMEITAKERKSLGLVLKIVLQKLHYKLNNPAYNYYIHSLPISHSLLSRYDERSYHWHLEILPRLNVWGGFELGSDVYVNTVLPEMSADIFRQK